MKKRVLSIFLICAFMLCGCGSKETQKDESETQMASEETDVRYEIKELPVPDPLLAENAQGSDYIGDGFEGFVADLAGLPAIYYSSISFEYEEYAATVSRYTLNEDMDWVSKELCENSLSEFLNNKYEQTNWKWCTLKRFKRGDDGNLYGIFVYAVKETVMLEGEETEVITQKYSLLQIDEENDTVFDVPLDEVIQVQKAAGRGEDNEGEADWLSDYHIFEDGKVLLIGGDAGGASGYLVDGESGQLLNELGNIVNGKKRFAYGESEVVFFSNGPNLFQVYGIPDMSEENTFGSLLDQEVIGKDWHFYMNPVTWELFLCNVTGVYKVENYQSSDVVDCLTVKTDMSEVFTDGAEVLDFLVGDEEDFYLCLQETTEEYDVETKQYRMLHGTKIVSES